MKKLLILLILSLSCFKNLNNLKLKNKGIEEDLIKAIIEDEKEKALYLIENVKNINYKYNNKSFLQLALEKGNLDVIRALLNKGPINVEEKNVWGNTALIEASGAGYKEIVKLLLEKGANISSGNKDSWTALMAASEKGHKDVVNILLDRNADVNAKNNDNWTALMTASYNGHLETVRILIERGADVNIKTSSAGWTSLMHASKNGHKEIVDLLIKGGANINHVDNEEATALIFAAQNGHKDIIELLLEKGANVNDAKKDGWTLLMAASERGHKDVINILLNKNADVNSISNDGYTSIILAARNGHKEVIEFLLEKNVNVNDKIRKGYTALMYASGYGHKEVTQLLLEKGANINDADDDGATSLIKSSYHGHLDVVKLLIEKGANINYSKKDGCTALTLASQEGHKEIIKLLLESGASINYKDSKGNTILSRAMRRGQRDVAYLLIENCCQIDEGIVLNNIIEEALIENIKKNRSDNYLLIANNYYNRLNLNYRDNEGNTLLHFAAKSMNYRLFNLLLNSNININELNKRGETPLYVCLSQENIIESFVWYLINNGAMLRPNSYIKDRVLVDVLLPYKEICNKLVYEPITLNLLGNNNFKVDKKMIKEIIQVIKIRENDFYQEKQMVDFIINTLTKDINNISIFNGDIPIEDLQDVELNIDVFKAIFANFTIDDYWDEVKVNLQRNIDTFIGRLDDIKNAPPIPKPDNKSSDKDKVMYMIFKAKKQLHKLLGYISLTAERGKNNDKIIFAINQILSELVCRGGSLEAIDLAVNTFTGESNNDLKQDLSILLLSLRKQLLKEAARGRCVVKYFDPMEGRDIEAKVEPEDPHLLIHLCNSFSNELKLPIHVDEYNFNYEYVKDEIMNEYNKIHTVDKIIEYMMNQIDYENSSALWNKVKDYIERNIFKGRPILQIDNFIYDDNYKMKKEAIIALLIYFGYLK